jgi:tungstate transport system substrate-binding protein
MSSLKNNKILVLIVVAVVVIAAGLAIVYLQPASPPQRLIIATTTSTVDTGLLDYLKPHFDSKFSANMTWLYLGTGQALEVTSRGDADVLLVHDRVREDAFVSSGNGTLRATVMYNDFIIVGPPNDPANARGTNATEAMTKIAQAGASGNATFVSRGDNSGTNALEKRLWTKAGISTNGTWYVSTGSGMAPTIRVANEKGGYTISDRGSFYKLRSTMNTTLSLVILCENDTSLLNPYGIILLNSTKYPNINSDLATNFLLFMVSKQGQSLIGNYTVDGKQLFFPVYGNPESIGLPPENATVTYLNSQLKSKGFE